MADYHVNRMINAALAKSTQQELNEDGKMIIASVIKNPYVQSFATWAWDSDPSSSVTPTLCLESLPLLTQPCCVRLIAKSIGICIILTSCVNKAPVIRNIIKSGSRSVTTGLSLMAMYGEIILYSNAAFYNVLRDNPFSAYGETLTVLLQTMIVVLLLWYYESLRKEGENNSGLILPLMMRKDVLFALLAYCVYLYVVFYVLPPSMTYILMVYNPIVLVISRGTQIYKNHKTKQTGAQSSATITMNLVGSLVRVGTTIKEIGFDFYILRSYGTSVLLNSILLGQIIIYSANTEEYLTKRR